MNQEEVVLEKSDPRDEAAMKKFQELQKNVDQKKKKETKKLPHMGTGNPHYDAKSAGISRVKDFKFTPVKEEVVTEKSAKIDTYLAIRYEETSGK